MAGVGHRATYTEDIVTFPASKTAAAATLTGTMVFDYEAAGYGGANLFLHGDTVSGDTLTMKTYVSFTTGDTAGSGNWIQVDEDGVGHNGTFEAGGGASYRRVYIPFAPRIRVDAVFDGAATLPTSHGLQVDVETLEYDPEAQRTVFTNVVTMGDSETEEQLLITKNGDTMQVNNPTKVMVWCRMANQSTIGDTDLVVNLQGSVDESNWWTITTVDTARPSNGDSIYANTWEIIERPDLPLYLRLQVTGDSSTYWWDGHGIQFYVISFE